MARPPRADCQGPCPENRQRAKPPSNGSLIRCPRPGRSRPAILVSGILAELFNTPSSRSVQGAAEGSLERPVRPKPVWFFAFFAVRSSLLRYPYPTMPQGPTARQPPRQSARFSTANNAKNANPPIAAQAPSEAFDLRTRVAGPNALSLWSVNGERRTALVLSSSQPRIVAGCDDLPASQYRVSQWATNWRCAQGALTGASFISAKRQKIPAFSL